MTAQSIQDLPKRPHARIIKAAEAQAWISGYTFLEKAEEAGQKLRTEAKRVYATEYAKGYDDGIEHGRQAGAELLTETTARVDAYLGTLQEEVVDLAIDIVQRMLGDFDVGELVGRAVAHAIADIRRARYVRVRVHPESVEAVRAELDDLIERARPAFSIEIDVDDQVPLSFCTVMTEASVVDVSIEGQLRAVRQSLLLEKGPAA